MIVKQIGIDSSRQPWGVIVLKNTKVHTCSLVLVLKHLLNVTIVVLVLILKYQAMYLMYLLYLKIFLTYFKAL